MEATQTDFRPTINFILLFGGEPTRIGGVGPVTKMGLRLCRQVLIVTITANLIDYLKVARKVLGSRVGQLVSVFAAKNQVVN
jgi:hypothetical protein